MLRARRRCPKAELSCRSPGPEYDRDGKACLCSRKVPRSSSFLVFSPSVTPLSLSAVWPFCLCERLVLCAWVYDSSFLRVRLLSIELTHQYVTRRIFWFTTGSCDAVVLVCGKRPCVREDKFLLAGQLVLSDDVDGGISGKLLCDVGRWRCRWRPDCCGMVVSLQWSAQFCFLCLRMFKLR